MHNKIIGFIRHYLKANDRTPYDFWLKISQITCFTITVCAYVCLQFFSTILDFLLSLILTICFEILKYILKKKSPTHEYAIILNILIWQKNIFLHGVPIYMCYRQDVIQIYPYAQQMFGSGLSRWITLLLS